MPRALVILLLATTALAQTTTQRATTTTSPATTQTTRPRTPTNETVTIDLAAEYGPFKPLARGFHRLTPTVRPSAEMLATLKPLLDDPTPVLITLGNTVKFDGAFPGEKGNWSKWDQGLQELAHQHRGKPVQWEIWDEPDRKDSFKGSREDFFSVWVRSHHLLKEIDPAAILVGPSISKHDGGWIGEFLKIGKDYQAPATIVSWHEERTRADIPGHIGGTEESFWQDGTIRNYVRIGADSATAGRYSPSDPALFLQPLHSAHRRNVWRGTTHDFAFKLTHLVSEKGEPRSLYHAYAAYAAMAAEGNREVRLSSDVTTAGVAAWNPAKRQGSAYIGRNFNRAGRFYLAGKVSLAFRNVKAKEVRVQASRIQDTGKDASKGPTPVFDTKLPIKNGEGKILLPDFASRDAYVITFTLP